MSGKIEVHAGDFFTVVKGFYRNGSFYLKSKKHFFFGPERIKVKDKLVLLQIATEESVKKVGGTVGWGITGGVLLGPVGLLAGVIFGGKKEKVTFVAEFNDGRKLFATTDKKTFIEIEKAYYLSDIIMVERRKE